MRIFIGLSLSNEIRNTLNNISKDLKSHIRGKYTDPSNYHITLVFIGETHISSLREIIDAVDSVAADIKSFKLTLNEIASFKKGNKHIIWAGTNKPPALINLHSRLTKMLHSKGLISDIQKLTPHITLVREGNDFKGNIAIKPEDICVNSIVVYESTRINDKLTYIQKYICKLKE